MNTISKITIMIAALLFPVSAQAQNVTHDVQLNATVTKICSFSGDVTTGDSAFSITDNENSVFTVQIDPQTSSAMDTEGTITFTNAFCNTASDVTLSRNGLSNGGTPTGNFDSSIYYHAKLFWGSSSEAIYLAPGSNGPTTVELGPIDGLLELAVDVNASENLKLLPGQFTDTLSLSIIPRM